VDLFEATEVSVSSKESTEKRAKERLNFGESGDYILEA